MIMIPFSSDRLTALTRARIIEVTKPQFTGAGSL
nr:unnamed protein product [Digitaria exilis]